MSSISTSAQAAVKDAGRAGIIKGKEDGFFDPKGNATRAEAITVILNVLNLHPDLKQLLDSLK
ncbi:S-layer homology domain-containing protein [Paenibacillus sp. NPDC057967]|uniref:S-layer homology domain-containing protein n=1 Tax=Paenibacillus sp. NPDC057967 TaxID=3346293 RepID=UPI0036D86D44